MVDAGGPRRVRKCHGVALADLGDTDGFGRDGKEDRLYAVQLSEGVYKRKEVTHEGVESLKVGELNDLDTSYAVPKRAHTLAFSGASGLPLQTPSNKRDGLLTSKSYVATGKRHKVQKVVNSGTRLCSYIPETKNIIIQEAQDKCSYVLKTSNSTKGILKMVSEFSPVGIIGLGLASSMILLEIFLGDFVDVLPGFKLKWPQTHANKEIGVHILVKETPQVNFTLESIQHQTDYRTLNLDKILLGSVSLKRLRFIPGELTPDQAAVVIDQ